MARKRKERKLTDAERHRLDGFTTACSDLEAQGYRRVDLRVSILAANLVALVAALVLLAVALPLFIIAHPGQDLFGTTTDLVLCLLAFVALVFAHELVHGYTWSRFTPNGFNDVEFGIMRDSLTPYCACLVPLPRTSYVIGALMPLFVFGIVPLITAFCTGLVPLFWLGILMTISATGDVMIVAKALRYKSASDDVLLFDHPTEAGSVLFER